MKAHLRIPATGKCARFQPQSGWFILLAELDTDPVLTPPVEYAVELAAAKRPDGFLHFGPPATDCRLFIGDPLEHNGYIVPLDQPCTLRISHPWRLSAVPRSSEDTREHWPSRRRLPRVTKQLCLARQSEAAVLGRPYDALTPPVRPTLLRGGVVKWSRPRLPMARTPVQSRTPPLTLIPPKLGSLTTLADLLEGDRRRPGLIVGRLPGVSV